MPGTYFKSGSWNGICDVCSFKFKFTELHKRWDGLVVCEKDFEHDHPQKYIRVRESGLSVPTIRPQSEVQFVEGALCTYITSSGLADIGVADCARADGNGLTFELFLELYAPLTYALADIGAAGYATVGYPR